MEYRIDFLKLLYLVKRRAYSMMYDKKICFRRVSNNFKFILNTIVLLSVLRSDREIIQSKPH